MMKWNRIRLIITILLLIANIFVVLQLISLNDSTSSLSSTSINKLCAILSNDKINVSDEIVDPLLYNRMAYKISKSYDYFSYVCESFYDKNLDIVNVTYSNNNYNKMYSDGSSIELRDNFTLFYKSDITSPSLIDFYIVNSDGTKDTTQSELVVNQLNEFFSFTIHLDNDSVASSTFSIDSISYFEESDLYLYLLTQNISGYNFEDYKMYCLVKDDKIIEMSGEWNYSELWSCVEIKNNDIINCMYSFKNYVDSYRATYQDNNLAKINVTSIENSYSIYETNGNYYLIPSITIKLDNSFYFVVNVYDMNVIMFDS